MIKEEQKSSYSRPEWPIDEIKARLDIAEVAQQLHPSVTKKGKVYQGGHDGVHESSNGQCLTVWPDSSSWHCFNCGQGGSVIDLIGVALIGQSYTKQGANFCKAVEEAARRAGISLQPTDKEPKPKYYLMEDAVKVYDYTDEAGAVLYKVGRFANPKDFRPFILKGNQWVMGLPSTIRRVPYRLPLIRAADLKAPVFVVEGEKDADNLIKAGLVATTSQGGAKNWRDEYAPYFAQRNVVVIPDNDEAGRGYAQDVLKSVHRLAASVKLLPLEGLPEHGDVSDWLAAGHTAAELLILAQNAPDVTELYREATELKKQRIELPEILSAKELLAKEIPEQVWLVDNLITADGLAVLGGAAKVGKSYLVLNLGVAVATGGKFLGTRQCKKTGVLYLSLESNQRRDKERLSRMLPQGVIPDNLYIAWNWKALSQAEGGIAQIEQFLEDHPEVGLIIIDLLEAVRPAGRGRNAYTEDYAFLHPLRRLCFEQHKQMVFTTHTNKGSWENPFDGFQNSTGIQGASSVNLMLKEKEGEYTLNVRGNDVEPQTRKLEFSPEFGLFQEIGDAKELSVSEERQAILDILKGFPNGLKPSEIAEEMGIYDVKGKASIRQLLHSLHQDAQVSRDDNRKYYLPENHRITESQITKSQNHTLPLDGVEEEARPASVEAVNTLQPKNVICDSVIRVIPELQQEDPLSDFQPTCYADWDAAVWKATDRATLDALEEHSTRLNSQQRDHLKTAIQFKRGKLPAPVGLGATGD